MSSHLGVLVGGELVDLVLWDARGAEDVLVLSHAQWNGVADEQRLQLLALNLPLHVAHLVHATRSPGMQGKRILWNGMMEDVDVLGISSDKAVLGATWVMMNA
jgi:hypothetical protein